MALIGHGQWSLTPQYKQFGVSQEVSNKMNPEKKTQ